MHRTSFISSVNTQINLSLTLNALVSYEGFFMWLAVRLGIIWEPIPNPAFPGFEPGTATMPSEHVGTELTIVTQIDLLLALDALVSYEPI